MEETLKIASVDYDFSTRALNIYFSGIDEDNAEKKEIIDGTNYLDWLPAISEYLKTFYLLVDNIALKGGSPNKQPVDKMEIFLKGLKRRCNPKQQIVAFCGDEQEINQVLREYCNYIKIGAYKPELETKNNIGMLDSIPINLKSSNQKLLKKGEDY